MNGKYTNTTRFDVFSGTNLGDVKLHGVVNASPDSLANFSIALDTASAVARATELIQAGCVGIDLGGAGSTQFAQRVDLEEEWDRLDGKIQAIAALGVDLSVDTWNPEIMARAIDESGIQFRMLNKSKGPAMWSPRAQCDKKVFEQQWRKTLEENKNIDFWQDTAENITTKKGYITGIITKMGIEIKSKSVVLCNTYFDAKQ